MTTTAYDRKYCQRCQLEKPADQFKLVQSANGKRWACASCLAKKSYGIYASKKNK